MFERSIVTVIKLYLFKVLFSVYGFLCHKKPKYKHLDFMKNTKGKFRTEDVFFHLPSLK